MKPVIRQEKTTRLGASSATAILAPIAAPSILIANLPVSTRKGIPNLPPMVESIKPINKEQNRPWAIADVAFTKYKLLEMWTFLSSSFPSTLSPRFSILAFSSFIGLEPPVVVLPYFPSQRRKRFRLEQRL